MRCLSHTEALHLQRAGFQARQSPSMGRRLSRQPVAIRLQGIQFHSPEPWGSLCSRERLCVR
jgi:hypothetical protein